MLQHPSSGAPHNKCGGLSSEANRSTLSSHRRNPGTHCRFWRDCGVVDGGCCMKGHYGGKPSRGTCLVCPHYSGWPRGWGDIVYIFANPIGRILNFLADRRFYDSKKCRCSQRRRKWNNLR